MEIFRYGIIGYGMWRIRGSDCMFFKHTLPAWVVKSGMYVCISR
jgi:hypothetical protein